MNKQEVTKTIALTLAELGNHKTPTITEWGQAKVLADKFEAAGHIKYRPEVKVEDDEEPAVLGYVVVDRGNTFIKYFGTEHQEAAAFAAEESQDAKEMGIDWDYRVAAIVDQGGL